MGMYARVCALWFMCGNNILSRYPEGARIYMCWCACYSLPPCSCAWVRMLPHALACVLVLALVVIQSPRVVVYSCAQDYHSPAHGCLSLRARLFIRRRWIIIRVCGIIILPARDCLLRPCPCRLLFSLCWVG